MGKRIPPFTTTPRPPRVACPPLTNLDIIEQVDRKRARWLLGRNFLRDSRWGPADHVG